MTEDNDRVLIFFNEQETLPSGDRRTVSQVAQVIITPTPALFLLS